MFQPEHPDLPSVDMAEPLRRSEKQVMAENGNQVVEEIGAELKGRLPIDLSLPAKFAELLISIEAAEATHRVEGILSRHEK